MWNQFSRFVLWMTAGAVLLLSSCKKESDGQYFGVSYGNVVGSGDTYSIRTDGGEMLHIQENGCPDQEVKDGERVMASYSLLERVDAGYNIHLTALQNILTKTPVYLSQTPPSELEQIGNDPINVLSSQFGGKYMNLKMELFRKDPALVHSINLVVDEERSNGEAVYLTLRHNAYGDPTSIGTFERISFDLSGVVPAGQKQIKVYLEWTDYLGVKRSDSGIFTRPAGVR